MRLEFHQLTDAMQNKALELSRYHRNIVINFKEEEITTELPEFITVKFLCSDCQRAYKIKYKNVDWIYLTDVQGFDCPEEECEGKCYQEYGE